MLLSKVDYSASLQFLATAVSEAKDVICNIQNSIDEQKQLLAFSLQQQEQVRFICKLFFWLRLFFV